MGSLSSFSRRAVLGMPLALMACNIRSQVSVIAGLSMGTSYKVVAVDHEARVSESDIKRAIDDALKLVNARMSNWDSESEISRFNAKSSTDATEISPELATVMQAAADVNRASGGRFDTALGPLIELWGFGAPGGQARPNEDAILNALARSGQDRTLQLGASQLRKTETDTQIYLAGIGKGYGADHVGRAIAALGIKDYMVEIGGDLVVAGNNPDGQPWAIGIETPNIADKALVDVVRISGLGLATSGDYRNYFEEDGQRYSHLIDPMSGHPVTHKTASATVIAQNAMLADAWSTAMLILGRERGMAVAAEQGIAVQFVDRTKDGQPFRSFKSDAFLTLTS